MHADGSGRDLTQVVTVEIHPGHGEEKQVYRIESSGEGEGLFDRFSFLMGFRDRNNPARASGTFNGVQTFNDKSVAIIPNVEFVKPGDMNYRQFTHGFHEFRHWGANI